MGKKLNRIMLVDDESQIHPIVQLALEGLGGFEVMSCTSGEEAIQKAPAFRPDLVLVDVMMPEMDGIETLSALRGLPPLQDTDYAFFTGRTAPKDLQTYESLGALGTIEKPFDPLKLAEEVQVLWSKAGH